MTLPRELVVESAEIVARDGLAACNARLGWGLPGTAYDVVVPHAPSLPPGAVVVLLLGYGGRTVTMTAAETVAYADVILADAADGP